MMKPIKIKPLEGYKIWIKFDDGIEGTVDLSHLAGKGVFSNWKNYDNFKKAQIGKYGEIVWDRDIEICSDNLYLQLTGKNAEEVFGKQKREKLSA